MACPPLKLDRKTLLGCGGGGGGEDSLELEVVNRDQSESELAQKEYFDQFTDHGLEDKIQRLTKLLQLKLKDGGEKIRVTLRHHVDERERRKLLRLQKVADGCAKSSQSPKSSSLDIFSPAPSTDQSHQKNSFVDLFSQRLEKKPDTATHVASGAFTDELGYFGRRKPKCPTQNGFWTIKETRRSKMSSRQSPFCCPTSLQTTKYSKKHLDHDHKGIDPSGSSCTRHEETWVSHFSEKRRASPVQTSLDLKKMKAQTVVLLDEEDSEPMDKLDQENDPTRWTKEIKIYYPSRNHPECVEICHADVECLAPQSYLSSPIMNFYIKYLQRPECVSNRPQVDYHFFNTYFYKKLEEALSCKKTVKNDSFIKFRRWWKGVNIFQKAYIFLPIHSDQHWSLVIICIPPVEDESGPIILHLDSLGMHSSSVIFGNIERYLTEEWKYLDDDVASLDFPIAHKIWNQLPSKIQKKKIEVPQQKNEYDCGLFVLFFMEKFIEDAPERVRKKNLDMFGRKWFHPEQASGLRKRIRSLLWEEFERAKLEKSDERSIPDSPAVSSDNGEEEIQC